MTQSITNALHTIHSVLIFCRSTEPKALNGKNNILRQMGRCEYYAHHYGLEIIDIITQYDDEVMQERIKHPLPLYNLEGLPVLCRYMGQHSMQGTALLLEHAYYLTYHLPTLNHVMQKCASCYGIPVLRDDATASCGAVQGC